MTRLTDAYRRRDELGQVTFRGKAAQLLSQVIQQAGVRR